MKQGKQTSKPARAIDPRSLAQATGGNGQPLPWIVIGTGPMLEPEPSPW
jgi:hypothetical protein